MITVIKDEILKSINEFKTKNILVIGDIMVDEYIWGSVNRISPEAPVPVVLANKETKIPGGATNVVNNLVGLNTNVFIAGVVGVDENAKFLKKYLKKKKVNIDSIFTEEGRYTSLKTRIVAHNQQIVRVDKETIKPISKESVKKILNFVKQNIKNIDAIIISDYGKGVIIPEVIEPIIKYANKYNKIISVDPKIEHFFYYKNVSLITPNHFEASKALNIKLTNQEDVYQAGKKIMKRLNLQSLFITQSSDGMSIFVKNRKPKHIPTSARKVYDVTGAGDTVISTATAALSTGLDFEKAAILSNYAAGIVVGEVGTTTISAEKLRKALENE